jgi:hypothetical protein
LFVQIQRCVIWKVSNLDEIRYDDKLKEEEHEENINDNDNKQVVEPLQSPLQIASFWWGRMCKHRLLTHGLLQQI